METPKEWGCFYDRLTRFYDRFTRFYDGFMRFYDGFMPSDRAR